ncbi:MAG TPA: hypothetical protein VMS08_03490 [Candidatus Saccharimonadia bacterium]|nr:hypothetical protein [Candidatus Saccharimonadia bacterium]
MLKTFDEVYTDAITADDLVVQAATTALNAGLITSVQAQRIQVMTVDAKNLLMAAQTAFIAGNQVTANQDVTAAAATLIAMGLCLSQKPLTVTTFAACAATVPPVGMQK